jgi:hypothetical protein
MEILFIWNKVVSFGGEYMQGYAHPPRVTITSYGIDTVDNITNQIITDVSMDGNHENVQKEIKTISDEPNPKKRIIGIWNTSDGQSV